VARSRYSPCICLVGLRRSTENLGQASRCEPRTSVTRVYGVTTTPVRWVNYFVKFKKIEAVSSSETSVPTKLHGVTSQKTVVLRDGFVSDLYYSECPVGL
jgi:hypothetical protein